MPAEHFIARPILAELLQGMANAPAIGIAGIASDSRRLAADYLFLACQGDRSHGLDYIDDAIRVGVAAIAWDPATVAAPEGVSVPMIPVAGLNDCLGEIANRYFGHPSKSMQVYGVTGTNGKTTVAWMIAESFANLGKPCGYIGTLGSGVASVEIGDGMTTPGAIELHERFAEFRDLGAGNTAIEVSSHAIAQNRIDGVSFDTVLFTNLSRDHLDYHGDMQSYGNTKAKLFLDSDVQHRIINIDTEFGAALANRCGSGVVVVSTDADRVPADTPFVFVKSVAAEADGSRIAVQSSWGEGEIALSIPGEFNVANAISVLALLLQHGVTMVEACAALSEIDAPPGRMQRVASAPELPAVYVDYAHTPDALEVALNALRAHCSGKLWCVFGCGGDRDKGKRPLMGSVAERLADHVVITNDNPRSETPSEIISAIAGGLVNADSATVIEDRAAAIAWTINSAGPDDTVLIAGKGHENHQILGNERRTFSDYAVARSNLEACASPSQVLQ